MRPHEPKRVKIEDIQKLVASHYSVTRADILSSRRTATVVKPRQIAMYLAKTLTLRSLPEIGRRFGGRDHTTVLHAVRKIEGLCRRSRAERGTRAAQAHAAGLTCAPMTLIFKIAGANEWRAAEAAGVFDGAAVDRADGYIHFSTAAQAAETAAKWFAGRDDLVLAAVDADALGRPCAGSRRGAARCFPISMAPAAVGGALEAGVAARRTAATSESLSHDRALERAGSPGSLGWSRRPRTARRSRR